MLRRSLMFNKTCFDYLYFLTTVSKSFKINLEGQNCVHFDVILSRNVKLFGIMTAL